VGLAPFLESGCTIERHAIFRKMLPACRGCWSSSAAPSGFPVAASDTAFFRRQFRNEPEVLPYSQRRH